MHPIKHDYSKLLQAPTQVYLLSTILDVYRTNWLTLRHFYLRQNYSLTCDF